jgi:peptide/nickel transport system substrate-binding protein
MIDNFEFRVKMSIDHKKSKRKSSKSKKFIAENKPLVAGGFITVVAIAGIISGIYIYNLPPDAQILTYGMIRNPYSPDPLRALFEWDFFSYVVILQVMEGLFTIEYFDGTYNTINNLASDYIWSPDGLNFTCFLKQNVKFHDGTPFDALAVKWNLDRIHRLVPYIGGYLWHLPDDSGWIINQTIIVDDYTVRFVLNQPFTPLRSLLASPMAFMLSPSSTPEDNFIVSITSDYCGTGPFMFESYTENVSLTLTRNPNYWRGPIELNKIIFKIIFDPTTRLDAMKSKELSMTFAGSPWTNENRTLLANTPGITVEYTDTMTQYYLFMNNVKINTTMRKAISFAFDYSSYIEEFMPYNETRSKSPIPKQLPYSNWEDFDVPYYNITKARKILIDANWNGTSGLPVNDDITSGNAWEFKAISSFPLAEYQFSYVNGDYGYTGAPLDSITENLAQIGVKVVPEPLSGYEFYGRLFETWGFNRSMLEELYFLAYNPPYNDPHSVIYPLFSIKGINDNFAQVNDSLIQLWIEEASKEINSTLRDLLYYQIQERLIEEVYPMLWIHNEQTVDAYLTNIRDVDVHTYIFKNMFFI